MTSLSLRAAGVVYEHAGDAQRALEAAQEGMVYLANVWAPEAQMVSDPGGKVAQSQYETVVQQPVPALQPPPTAVVRGYGTGGGGAAAGGGVNQQLSQVSDALVLGHALGAAVIVPELLVHHWGNDSFRLNELIDLPHWMASAAWAAKAGSDASVALLCGGQRRGVLL